MTNTEKIYDVLIIGAGAAGLNASIYVSRYNLSNVVIGEVLGGQISESHRVENYLGFKSIPGLELAKLFEEQVKFLGSEIIYDRVATITKEGNLFKAETLGKRTLLGKTVIYAAGSAKRKLNVPGEKELSSKGVSYCPTCDAFFFKDKTVAVVGGGDSAVTAAILLTEFATKVYLIHRGDKLRAEPVWQTEMQKNPKIEVIYSTQVKQINGTNYIESITLDKEFNGSTTLPLEGLFIEIGSDPAIEPIKSFNIEMDGAHIKVDNRQGTNVPFLYAAGDLTNGSNKFDQLITAASEGAVAANSVYQDFSKKRV